MDSHLLIVDDDERIRSLLQQFLIQSDYLVSTAEDAEQAEEISSIGRVRGKLDQADELLNRLSRGTDAEAVE